jgi:hypothetical protein
MFGQNRCKRGFAVWLPLIVIYCWPTASYADLSKIDRSIGKEPAYQSKTPKYCLVVPDVGAKTKIWLVLDGDVLYVDHNGTGDLTEAGKKIAPRPVLLTGLRAPGTKEPKALHFDCPVGKDFHVSVMTIEDNYVQVDVKDTTRRLDFAACGDGEGALQFASRAQDAPIIYCGPLSFLPPGNQVLPRGDKPANLTLHIGGKGQGAGTTSSINTSSVPADKHPIAEIEFPKKDHPGETIRTQFVLDHRC